MTVSAEMSWGFEVAVASCPVGAQNTEECWKETSQAGGRPLKEPGRAEKGSYSSLCRNISIPGLRHLGHSSLLHQHPGSLTWPHFLGELGCTLGMQNRGGWGSRWSKASHQKASGLRPFRGRTGGMWADQASQGLFVYLLRPRPQSREACQIWK